MKNIDKFYKRTSQSLLQSIILNIKKKNKVPVQAVGVGAGRGGVNYVSVVQQHRQPVQAVGAVGAVQLAPRLNFNYPTAYLNPYDSAALYHNQLPVPVSAALPIPYHPAGHVHLVPQVPQRAHLPIGRIGYALTNVPFPAQFPH